MDNIELLKVFLVPNKEDMREKGVQVEEGGGREGGEVEEAGGRRGGGGGGRREERWRGRREDMWRRHEGEVQDTIHGKTKKLAGHKGPV